MDRDDVAAGPPVGGPVHDAVAGLEAIAGGARRVADAGTATLSDGELRQAVEAAWRARARVEAAYLHVLGALDGRDGAVPGARPGRGGRTFLVHAVTAAPGSAAADVAAARALDPDLGSLPVMGAALAAGEVSRAHADVAVRTLRRIPSHLAAHVGEDGVSGAARVDAFLTEHSRRHSPRDVDRLAAQLLATLAPERADRYDPDAVTRRHAYWATDSTGMLVGRFQLDPACGATVKAALDLFLHRGAVQAEPSVAGGVDGDGQGVLPVADERSGGQRAADAFTDMAATALRAAGREGGAPAARPSSQVMVFATAEQLAAARRAAPGPVDATTGGPQERPPTSPHSQPGEPGDAGGVGQSGDSGGAAGLAVCSQAGPLSVGAFGRLACDAALQPVVLDGQGAVLHLDRTTRLASAAQRRALAARDRGCVAPGCGAPPSMCEAHHVRWWRHGGGTNIDNLALLCARHHTAVHTGHWQLSMIDGVPWMIPPRWADPHQRPRRNTLHHDEHTARRLGQQLRLRLPGDPDPPRPDPPAPPAPDRPGAA